MTVTWRNTQYASSISSASQIVTKPTGTVDGDLLILQIVKYILTSADIEGLQNWIEIPNTNIVNLTRFTSLYYRYALSEPADYTFTTSAASGWKVSITSFYGASNVAIDTYATQINAASTNRTWPSITMTAAGMMACFGTVEGTTTPPAGMTERLDATTPSLYLMTESVAIGATGTKLGTGASLLSSTISLGLIENPAKRFYGLHHVSFTQLAALSSAGTRTINKPAGVINKDLMILSIAFTTDATPTLPSGWTLIQESITGSNTLRTYYKVASGEPADYTITWTGTQTISLTIAAFRAFNAWLATLIASNKSTNTATTTVAYPALTPTVINQLLVLMVAPSANNTFTPVQPNSKRIGVQNGITSLSTATEHLLSTASTTGRTTIINTSANTKVVSAIFGEVEPTPTAPSGLTATAIGQNQINLTWADNYDYATSIKIERSLDGSTGWTEIASVAIGVQAYSNTGLSSSTLYYYRVRSLVESVYSVYSSSASATTYPGLLDPTGLTADAYHPRKILLVWADPNVDTTGYELERSPNGTTGWALIATILFGTNQYADVTRTPETIYYYRVRSYKVT